MTTSLLPPTIVVMPIGGIGQRLKDAGILTPKPLIPYQGKPLVAHAIASYTSVASAWLFVVRREYLPGLEPWFPSGAPVGLLTLEQPTKGPVETLLWAERELLAAEGMTLLIADCDSCHEPWEIEGALRSFVTFKAEGGVTIQPSTNPSYSYAIVEDGWVTRTAEKEVISPWTTTGPYWWRDIATFVNDAKSAGTSNVCPVYNPMLTRGGRVRAHRVWRFQHLGEAEKLCPPNPA